MKYLLSFTIKTQEGSSEFILLEHRIYIPKAPISIPDIMLCQSKPVLWWSHLKQTHIKGLINDSRRWDMDNILDSKVWGPEFSL